ncbi:MAG: class I SAM-dependent methyltransferase [Bacteroidota bacterium]
MGNYLEAILNKLDVKNPTHSAHLRKNHRYLGKDHALMAEDFFFQYEAFLLRNKLSLDYSIDCYLHLIEDMAGERIRFIRNGRYSSSSFREVEKKIYHRPEVMSCHMHGLALAQFLWFEQYERLVFFLQNLRHFKDRVKNYLEIGGGYGLYIYEALKQLPGVNCFDLIDVSKSSIELASGIVDSEKVNYHQMNVFDFPDNQTYDFVTMGEVLEHVENPLTLLQKIGKLIGKDGISFISTPVNSPMKDHIYLFNNEEEIRELISLAGLEILKEKKVISDHVSEAFAGKFKVPVMFAAIVKLKND